MFIYKKKYLLIIENIKDVQLRNIKLSNKFLIIYRNKSKTVNFEQLFKFRQRCKAKHIDFYVGNNLKLMNALKADGLYISAHNKKLNLSKIRNTKFKIIGSAHNYKELDVKKKQGCTSFIYSRLFKTKYDYKPGFLGIIRFNLLKLASKKDLVPLGGINYDNLNKLNLVNTNSFVLMSEIKKKPAKIFSRLF